jgi:hypothetical protein
MSDLTAKFPTEAAREILTKAVRPVFADWGLGEQATTALVDVLLELSRHDYSGIDALRDMLREIELNFDGDEFMDSTA